MADPATITAIAKAAAAALSDERMRKTIGWTVAAVLSPLILMIVLICSLLSGTANHNNTAVELCFHGGAIPGSIVFVSDEPIRFRKHALLIICWVKKCATSSSADPDFCLPLTRKRRKIMWMISA